MTIMEETTMVPEGEVASEVFLALLDIDPDLGCCPDVFFRVRNEPAVRRAILEQTIKPIIRRHIVTVNYDNPNHQLIDGSERFVVCRTGQQTVVIDEIDPDVTMSTAKRLELIRRLGYRPACLAETRDTFAAIASGRPDFIMSYCGPTFSQEGEHRTPALIATPQGVMPIMTRLRDRWDHSMLAVALA